ncbi:LysR substrate-binding domain-containing protein [Bradyrhizobium sp. SYSU BS000235]|uniref:LysR substrate-binding domain-containing protein n=1 Tax=Bradyrhizobium sp. SYSU BS000235 TaxID=3411332 RepID=UPI003C72750B
MDLRQLRYFAQIVESGSLSKASRCLFVAQPALSQQLAKLEDEVGKPLLHRSARGVTPTDNGLALYHHARFMLRQLDQALSIARQEAGEVRGMVSLGLPSTTLVAVGLPLMRRIHEKYPGILLNVVEGMSGHIAQMIRLGQLDLAILFVNDVSSKLDATPLLEEELFVLLPQKSKLLPSDQTSITVAEVAKLPLILPTGTHGLRRRVVAEFERRDVTPHVVAEIDSLTLLMNCVYDGMGVTIKPMSALQLEGERGKGWRALRISDARITRRNYIYSIAKSLLSPAASAVAIELRDTAQMLVTSGKWRGVTLVDAPDAVTERFQVAAE